MLLKSVNIAIVDDHALFRKTLKNFLEEQHTINVIFQAADARELLNELKFAKPDILLMDIFLPDTNSIEIIREIRHEYPAIKILAISMSQDLDLIIDLLDSGIHGFISKSDEPDDLLQAIQSAREGRMFKNKHLTEALYYRQSSIASYINDSSDTLSDRDKKVIELLWKEKSNKEIADELFLGIRSVEKIRQDMKEKIGVKSTVGLLKYAITNKIINLL